MIRCNDAGLRNVWPANGYERRRTAYGNARARKFKRPQSPMTRPRPAWAGRLRQSDRDSGAHSDRLAAPPGARRVLICGLNG